MPGRKRKIRELPLCYSSALSLAVHQSLNKRCSLLPPSVLRHHHRHLSCMKASVKKKSFSTGDAAWHFKKDPVPQGVATVTCSAGTEVCSSVPLCLWVNEQVSPLGKQIYITNNEQLQILMIAVLTTFSIKLKKFEHWCWEDMIELPLDVYTE